MKRLTLIVAIIILGTTAFAGGILTNANQSAQYVRMFSRNASTTFDAVYYNPAGLMKMDNGLYLSVNNQTITQTRNITSTNPLLNRTEFKGDVLAPVFPDAYAILKMDKLAFSLGFGPIGGGGSANFKHGLPSFESNIGQMAAGYEMLAPVFAAYQIPGVTGYDANISFKGQSVFWGIQFGVSAKINDILSVYGGVRYLPSVNTYTGHITNISVVTSAGALPASNYQALVKPVMDGLIQTLNSASANLQAAINAGIIDGNGAIMDPTLQGTLDLLGSNAKTYNEALVTLQSTEGQLTQLNSANLNDQSVDTKQTGAGISPIVGVNISPNDKLNIGLKYEYKTGLKLTNKTKVDDTGLFPNGQKTSSDLPSLLTAGVDYKASKKLLTSASLYYYFDKGVNWGKNIYGQARTIESNSYEIAVALQYNITKNFAISGGYMYSPTGVSEQYQSDFSYSQSANSLAGGFQWNLSDKLTLDAGVFHSFYDDAHKSFGTYNETYDKVNTGFAIGLGYKIL